MKELNQNEWFECFIREISKYFYVKGLSEYMKEIGVENSKHIDESYFIELDSNKVHFEFLFAHIWCGFSNDLSLLSDTFNTEEKLIEFARLLDYMCKKSMLNTLQSIIDTENTSIDYSKKKICWEQEMWNKIFKK